MKKVTLKSISIRNFKGIKELDFDFNGKNATISGDNATGKTTVFDAFLWLLFGKDSTDRKEFGFIPLDENNQQLEKVDNEVSAVLDEDGTEIILKRVNHQKWQKKRGSTEAEYTGNETLFYYNRVPQRAMDYKVKIETIMDEGVFKLVTNPLYFNSLPWQDRRQVLTSIAGEVSLEDIAARINGEAKELQEIFIKGKRAEEYRREINAEKRRIKEDLASIPTRIDELNRSMPDPVDAKTLQKQIVEKQKAIDELDEQIADVRKETEVQDNTYRALRDSRDKLQSRADEIRKNLEKELKQQKYARDSAIEKATLRIDEIKQRIESKERQKKFEEEGLKADQNAIEKLRQEWKEENARELFFDDKEFVCPTCKRPYKTKDIDKMKVDMTAAFRNDKKNKLEAIDVKGNELKSRIEKVQNNIREIDNQIKELKESFVEAEEVLKRQDEILEIDVDGELAKNREYQDILKSIAELDERLSQPRRGFDISAHQEMKHSIQEVLDDLKKQMNTQEIIGRTNARIKELTKTEKDLSQQLANLEKTEFQINEFIKARTDLIEERINNKFSMVRFKMFDQQINGAEVETCETLISGVPFSDANNGARINAGLDIINALSEHYGVSAPIFIDNKEAVNKLIDCDSQLINLVVTREKQLTLK